jgi:hypothetical protein
MSGVEAVAVACALVTAGAGATLRRDAAFCGAAAGAIGAAVCMCFRSDSTPAASCAAIGIGLTTFAAGLLFARTMLRRSVSLNLLVAHATERLHDVDESIAARLDDLVKYRLAAFDGRLYRLTTPGRVMCTCLRIAYAATRLTE